MAEKLREYERKRDPARTPEPFTSAPKRRGRGPIFVVQRHDARNLHYDFRLERAGALASWAVPKGVPLEPGVRVLAVHVEDHPLDYASFQGEIPKGSYGGGTVEIWDRGTYELVEEKPDGGLTVRLHGERLEGTWTLVPAKLGGEERNWLLFRKADDAAPAPGPRREYRPMLATQTDKLPRGDDWLFEIKWDGYRALGIVRGGEARLVSRNGNDLTARFPDAAKELAKAVRSPECVVDGEVCALDDEGRPSFSAMQQGKPGTPIVYQAFDLLELDGTPVVDRPLTERRALLEELLDRAQPHDSALGRVRRRRGAAHRRGGAGPRGRDGEARDVALRRRAAHARLAQVQDEQRRRVRDLRLDGGTGTARRPVRLARARDVPRQGARLGRQRRHRLQRPRHRRPARAARAAAREDVAARRRAEDAEGARCRRDVGAAGARLRGRVRGVDA